MTEKEFLFGCNFANSRECFKSVISKCKMSLSIERFLNFYKSSRGDGKIQIKTFGRKPIYFLGVLEIFSALHA